MRWLLIIGLLCLLTLNAWADEYWRGWCAGTGHRDRGVWILASRQNRLLDEALRGNTPLSAQQTQEIEKLKREHSGLWSVHGQPFTFLCNGCNGAPHMLWVTCPSGETQDYDWERPNYGRPTEP